MKNNISNPLSGEDRTGSLNCECIFEGVESLSLRSDDQRGTQHFTCIHGKTVDWATAQRVFGFPVNTQEEAR